MRRLARLDAELPPEARPLLVGQAAVFHLDHRVAYNTVFNPEMIELLASGKTADEFRRGSARAESDPHLRRLERDPAASRAGRIRIHRFRHARPIRRLGRGRRARDVREPSARSKSSTEIR